MLIHYIVLMAALMGCGSVSNAEDKIGLDDQVWAGTLKAGGQQLRIVAKLRKDATGKFTGTFASIDQSPQPITIDVISLRDDGQLDLIVKTISGSYSGKIDSSQKKLEGTWKQGGADFPLNFERRVRKTVWTGDLPVVKLRLVFNVFEQEGKEIVTFGSVRESEIEFEASMKRNGEQLEFNVPGLRASFEGTLNKERDQATGHWSQNGQRLALTMKIDPTMRVAFVKPKRPQHPTKPYSYRSRDVVFVNKQDKVALAGTLTLPRAPGKYPAVILISGSGPQDRDETLFDHKPFLVLADHLTKLGIAVLRYDDRGFGKSKGDFRSATTADFTRDASAAIDFLKNHSEINPQKVGALGHSEGGIVTSMLAAQRDDLAFIVQLAGTGVAGDKIHYSQTKYNLELVGTPPDEVEAFLSLHREVIEYVKTLDNLESAPAGGRAIYEEFMESLGDDLRNRLKEKESMTKATLARIATPWYKYFLQNDPIDSLRRVKCPTLLLFGGRDRQVFPMLNEPPARKALETSGNKDFEVYEFARMNHLFQRARTGLPTEYGTIQHTIADEVLKKVGDWILERTR